MLDSCACDGVLVTTTPVAALAYSGIALDLPVFDQSMLPPQLSVASNC